MSSNLSTVNLENTTKQPKISCATGFNSYPVLRTQKGDMAREKKKEKPTSRLIITDNAVRVVNARLAIVIRRRL